MAEDKGCPEENSVCRKQHSNHEAQMQSQKAGKEQGQAESAVEHDVHNLGESFSFAERSCVGERSCGRRKLRPSTEPRECCLV